LVCKTKPSGKKAEFADNGLHENTKNKKNFIYFYHFSLPFHKKVYICNLKYL